VSIETLIKKLRANYSKSIEKDPSKEISKYRIWSDREGLLGWEGFSVPEENHYEKVLSSVKSDEVIFDVGAGDLRLDLMLCEKVKRVYAVEVNPVILASALKTIAFDIPKNLIVIRANAFDLTLPEDVTTILCLMIHRKHDFPTGWSQKRLIMAYHGGLHIGELKA